MSSQGDPDTMKHSKSVPFHGDVAKALDAAATSLMALGFRIAAKDRASLRVTGSGMMGTSHSPLRGASRIQLSAGADGLSLDADLGTVESQTRFIRFVPLAIIMVASAIMLGVVTAFSPEPVKSNAPAGFAVLFIIVWTIISQLLTRAMVKRTCRALDTLLDNMVVIGGGS